METKKKKKNGYPEELAKKLEYHLTKISFIHAKNYKNW